MGIIGRYQAQLIRERGRWSLSSAHKEGEKGFVDFCNMLYGYFQFHSAAAGDGNNW